MVIQSKEIRKGKYFLIIKEPPKVGNLGSPPMADGGVL
jgi:hypothetical protein